MYIYCDKYLAFSEDGANDFGDACAWKCIRFFAINIVMKILNCGVIMIVLFWVIAGIFAGLFFLSKGKYDDYIAPLDKKAYPLKNILPMGFFIMNAIKYKYNSKYDRDLLTKVAEISGHKYAQYYLQVHWANKIAYILLASVIIAFLGVGMEADIGFGVFSLFILAAIAYYSDKELDEKIKKRRLSIQMDFPDFLNKLTLLINAGMTVGRAWEKVVFDNKKDSPLYQELTISISDIKAGKSEAQAYEDFAKRCRTPEITKFISVIIQNLKKGSTELISVLRLQANECWEMRKSAAKRLGEEASTKMLFPMMIMFLAILIIVALPAVLALQGV